MLGRAVHRVQDDPGAGHPDRDEAAVLHHHRTGLRGDGEAAVQHHPGAGLLHSRGEAVHHHHREGLRRARQVLGRAEAEVLGRAQAGVPEHPQGEVLGRAEQGVQGRAKGEVLGRTNHCDRFCGTGGVLPHHSAGVQAGGPPGLPLRWQHTILFFFILTSIKTVFVKEMLKNILLFTYLFRLFFEMWKGFLYSTEYCTASTNYYIYLQ